MVKFLEGLGDELSLYVRHCAWLNAVPEESGSDQPTKKKPVTRREALRKELKMAETEELEMPPCDAQFLVGYLFEIGPTQGGGMGDAPLSHTEIEAFQRNTGIELDAWGARTLRRMSADYLAESQRAVAEDCPAPWQEAPYARPSRALVADRMRAATRALAEL